MARDDDIRDVTRRVGGRVVFRPRADAVLAGPVVDVGRLALDPFPVTALRTADLLLVRFSFQNLRFVDGGVLQRRAAGRPAHLIADFPPQHLVEQAFPEKGNPGLVSQPELPGGRKLPEVTETDVAPPAPPVLANLSQHSRLAFTVTTEKIRWSLDGLLEAMSTLPLSIAPHATNPQRFLVPFDELVVDKLGTSRVQRRVRARGAGRVPPTQRAV
jgi:hypothetical protein